MEGLRADFRIGSIRFEEKSNHERETVATIKVTA
jgi:hypothetical protein